MVVIDTPVRYSESALPQRKHVSTDHRQGLALGLPPGGPFVFRSCHTLMAPSASS